MLLRNFEEPDDPVIDEEYERIKAIRIKNMFLQELSKEKFAGLDETVEKLFKIKNNTKLVDK